MDLKDLLNKVPRSKVELALYKMSEAFDWEEEETTAEKWVAYHMEGYDNLLKVTPKPTLLSLCVEEGHVYGIEDSAKGIIDHRMEEYPSHGFKPTYAIEYTPWEQWLSMELSIASLCLDEATIIAECLWEMTWGDNDNNRIQEKWNCRLEEYAKIRNNNEP